MIYQKYQIKGLEKLVNSSSIMDIYPMVDKISITRPDDQPYLTDDNRSRELWYMDVFLNDPEIVDETTMFEKDLDVLYLVDRYLVDLFPYLGIDTKKIPYLNTVVWDTDGNSIFSWSGM